MEKIDFEKELKRLEEIVNTIQNEELPLEKASKLYEEAKEIVKRLEKELKEKEGKIEEIDGE